MSRRSLREMGATVAPRRGSISTRFCAASRWSASRSGVALTPYRAVRSAARSRWPGVRTPSMMSTRKASSSWVASVARVTGFGSIMLPLRSVHDVLGRLTREDPDDLCRGLALRLAQRRLRVVRHVGRDESVGEPGEFADVRCLVLEDVERRTPD